MGQIGANLLSSKNFKEGRADRVARYAGTSINVMPIIRYDLAAANPFSLFSGTPWRSRGGEGHSSIQRVYSSIHVLSTPNSVALILPVSSVTKPLTLSLCA